MRAMHEIELKFQIPAERLAAVRAELGRLGADLAAPLILQAAYFDTTDRKLAQARSALRVRREGDEWVQTLKAAGSHTMVRVEDNQPAQAPAD
ncbi:CYTH domain-containing protein, partial [Aquabacterium sp. UBA2148]|uniref:CYTH domain-containing protein n=1 Tax=Aquabacterium sp. UBA2148 TaxID=1946042 RepID=UPI00257CD5B9